MSSIKPFKISVPDAQLDQLQSKLEHVTFPDELDDAGWDMGVPLEEIKRLTKIWKDDFHWRDQERKLNEQFAQFTTNVPVSGFGELEIHFVHEKSKSSKTSRKAIPLLFVHGWPGSFLEATKLIPLLTNDGKDQPAFDVVVPSLPNFGFSDGVKKRGFGLVQYAEAMHGVMTALGYDEYVIQGGDWGSMISRAMAKLYPTHVKAVHLNFIPVFPWKIRPLAFLWSLLTCVPFSAKDRAHIATSLQYVTQGNGYMRQQESYPQTLGYGLHDSPVALLAWIYDKLHAWSDAYPWTDEEILTWVSIYQFSRAGPAASTRIYYEASHNDKSDPRSMSLEDVFSICANRSVKFAVVQSHKELIKMPLAWCRMIGNVVRESEFEVGGHFAAWEVPELLARDLKGFFGENGQAFGVVDGRDGY